MEYVNIHMDHAIGYEYVQLYFSEEEKRKVGKVRTGSLRNNIFESVCPY